MKVEFYASVLDTMKVSEKVKQALVVFDGRYYDTYNEKFTHPFCHDEDKSLEDLPEDVILEARAFMEKWVETLFTKFHSEEYWDDFGASCINYVIIKSARNSKETYLYQLSAIRECRKKEYTIYFYNLEGVCIDKIETPYKNYQEMDDYIRDNYSILKVLPCGVYRNEMLGDCTNNGITKYCNEVYVFGGKVQGTRTAKTYTNLLEVRERCGATILKPIASKYATSMFGGNFAYTSNCLFGYDTPLPVHDRVERGY